MLCCQSWSNAYTIENHADRAKDDYSQGSYGDEDNLFHERRFSVSNVPRQVSLAGTAGGSNKMGAKALGLLFCQQALCLSGGMSKWCSSKLPTGQRLTGRVCSAILFI